MFMQIFLFLLIFLAAPVALFADEYPQELHLTSKGEAHFIGAELINKHAANLYTVEIWHQKWKVELPYNVRYESAYGARLVSEEVNKSDILEIIGRPIPDKVASIEAAIIRNLSVKTGVPPALVPLQNPPAPSPAPQSSTDVSVVNNEKQALFTATISLGMRSKDVARLQEFLQKKKMGIPDDGPVTGYFGKVTEKALKFFQKSYGIKETGALDQKTREIINTLLGAKTP